MWWLGRALACNAAQDVEVSRTLVKLKMWRNAPSWLKLRFARQTSVSRAMGGTERADACQGATCAESDYRVTAHHSEPRCCPIYIQQSGGSRMMCSIRRLSCCTVVGNKSAETSSSSVKNQPSAAASQVAGFGVVSMFGLFGKRILLILGGKKLLFGTFSVLSLQKLLFLPAWIMVLSVSVGAHFPHPAKSAKTAGAPFTGRKRALLITEAQEVDIGERAWHALLEQGVRLLPYDDDRTQRCARVGKTIVHALQLMLPQHKGREWMFSVAKSSHSEIEAYSMAPGFVVVSEGLMQMCKTDAELAFVLAHEMAHVIARHVSERQSRHALWGTLLESLEQSLGISSDKKILDLLLHLPLSRELEAEADEIALVLMSKACYDPEVASLVFSKMQRLRPAPLDWGHHWSTHPSFETRGARVQVHVTRVMREVPCYLQDSLQIALTSKPNDS